MADTWVGTSPAEITEANRNRNRAASYSFPEDLGSHRMVMAFKPYSYGGTFGFSNVSGATKVIHLPIPSNLNDDTGVDSQQAQMGLTGALTLTALDALNGGAAALANQAYDIAKDSALAAASAFGFGDSSSTNTSLIDNYKLYAKVVGRNTLESIAPGAGTALDVGTGTAVNPYTTLDFSGVRLKTHNFAWTLSPKSQAESDAIRNIIKIVKSSMLPEYGGDGQIQQTKALLKYPNLVNIKLLGVNDEYYYKFKPCILQNLSVRFNEGNQLHIFEGGKPVVVQVSMQLLEAAIHTSEDYR